MNREDFEILNSGLIYFDNGATTLKPKCVVDELVNYYTKYTANCHRGDYKNSLIVDTKYENVRDKVKNLINAKSREEIVFTSGATSSLNKIVFGYMKNHLNRDDEVLLTRAEHASNVLPWYIIENEIGIKVKFIELSNELVTLENIESAVTPKTKVISLAHTTNVLGDTRPIKEIGEFCKKNNILFVVDGSQSIPHKKVDVALNNIDFLAFSLHKMMGPTGVGVLYGKKELLEELTPTEFGGGMNNVFNSDGFYELKSLPTRLEAGTPNIAGVIASGAAIDYINSIGYEKIESHIKNVRNYLLKKLENIPNIIIYNKDIDSNNIVFNIDKVFAQDTAVYLDKYNIAVRAGNHCAKILKDEINVKNTCRISLYLYNTIEECDKLISVLEKSENIFQEIL